MTQFEKEQKVKLDFMRNQVLEAELQARYWKAMFETKKYTLEDASLREAYNEYYEKVQKEAAEAREVLETIPNKDLSMASSIIQDQD